MAIVRKRRTPLIQARGGPGPSSGPDFNLTHPDYADLKDRWRMASDFWAGGRSVLQPGWKATIGHTATMVSGDDDSTTGKAVEPARKASRFEWASGRYDSYLWKHVREPLELYQERQARAVHLPVFQSVVNIYTAGILKSGASRGNPAVKVAPAWKNFWADVDLAGTNIDAFIRQALSLAQVFGRVHAITDKPHFDDKPDSLMHQQARGERPYCYLVSPLDLVDWELDATGRFVWVTIREVEPQPREPGMPAPKTRYQYRVWTTTSWTLWRETKNARGEHAEFIVAASGNHKVGEVPISTLWASRDSRAANMASESPLSDVLDMDREIFNRYSELDELERSQAFALLVLFAGDDGGQPGPMDIAPFSGLVVGAGAKAPQYIVVPPEVLVAKWTRIRDRLHTIRQLAGVSRGMSEISKEERSAEAITVESEDKRNQMAWWSGATEEFDHAIHRHVAKWDGQAEYPLAAYPRKFDLKGTTSQINDLVQLRATETLPREALQALSAPLVARILGEHGTDKEETLEVLKAVYDYEGPDGDEPEDEIVEVEEVAA